MALLSVPINRKRGIHSRRRATHKYGWMDNLWPSMGLRAFLVFVLLKLKRSVSDPHHVAIGVAVGMWANFLPLPFLGSLVALSGAWLLRGSLVGAFAGQTIGNAWTMPFIWWVCYKLGAAVTPMNEHVIGFKMLMQNFNLGFIMDNWEAIAHSVLLPLTIGGQLIAWPAAILAYVLVYVEMKEFKEFRQKRREEKAVKRMQVRGS